MLDETTRTWLVDSVKVFLSEYNCSSNSVREIHTIAATVIVSVLRRVHVDISKLLVDRVNLLAVFGSVTILVNCEFVRTSIELAEISFDLSCSVRFLLEADSTVGMRVVDESVFSLFENNVLHDRFCANCRFDDRFLVVSDVSIFSVKVFGRVVLLDVVILSGVIT